jgi:hypothetical protein
VKQEASGSPSIEQGQQGDEMSDIPIVKKEELE